MYFVCILKNNPRKILIEIVERQLTWSTVVSYGCKTSFQLKRVCRNFVPGLLWVSKQVFRFLSSSFLLSGQGGTVGLMPGMGKNKEMIFGWKAPQTGHVIQGC